MGEEDRRRAEPVTVVVSVDDDTLADGSAVVEELRQAGLVVDQILEAAGIVTGRIHEGAIGSLESVPGVVGVERERAYRISPPDSDIQ